MAIFDRRYPQNVVGKYYVDNQCIDCELCIATAPGIFRRHDEDAHAYVHRQPVTPEEIALCTECVEGCPTEAVGDDGDQPHPPPPPAPLPAKPWWRLW